MANEILIVSYITEHNRASKNLERSLKKYGYNYSFVGINDEWKGFIQGKIVELLQYLKTVNYDYICVIDGYDMLATGPPEELLHKYGELKSPIVYGGEKFCFSYNGTPVEKYKSVSIWDVRKFANGGFCIGKREDIIQMYRWIINKDKYKKVNDDQKLLGLYINRYPNRVSVDLYQHLVFNTITSIDCDNFEIADDRIYIKSMKTTPCFVHFPSSASDHHDRYNIYGRKILGTKFRSLFCDKISFNVFANMRLYGTSLIFTLLVLCAIFPVKYVILSFITVAVIVLELKVSALS
jgi:hypothetical protein